MTRRFSRKGGEFVTNMGHRNMSTTEQLDGDQTEKGEGSFKWMHGLMTVPM